MFTQWVEYIHAEQCKCDSSVSHESCTKFYLHTTVECFTNGTIVAGHNHGLTTFDQNFGKLMLAMYLATV